MTLAEGIPPQGRGAISRAAVDADEEELRAPSGRFSFNWSPLTRKIILYNLIALTVLVVGVLNLNHSDDALAKLHRQNLVTEAELIADVLETRLAPVARSGQEQADILKAREALDDMTLGGNSVFVFDRGARLVAERKEYADPHGVEEGQGTTLTYLLSKLSQRQSAFLANTTAPRPAQLSAEGVLQDLLGPGPLPEDLATTGVVTGRHETGARFFAVATPVYLDGRLMGTIGLVKEAGEIEKILHAAHEPLLQLAVIAALVSIGLSLLLASMIATPLSELAEAAELGRDRNRRSSTTGRIRIPDLTARNDEVGRLSGALRGMVSALYDRIDSNEQFAADVAHEIKNPLASLRSAVGTLRIARNEGQMENLLDVIEHDVRRLDRLVSDISNASRLDSELVKEEEVQFNLLETLANISEFLGAEAGRKGIDLIVDFPNSPIHVYGIEARLAQVFVNLITNAISFCEDGDAIRLWARQRENRILVVVEDTGPGIPEEALTKVFKRFYSERPESDFGNNSGLGLAISKQIVEAHGGVIWAENIRPTEADITSDPLGARFVVGLPV